MSDKEYTFFWKYFRQHRWFLTNDLNNEIRSKEYSLMTTELNVQLRLSYSNLLFKFILVAVLNTMRRQRDDRKTRRLANDTILITLFSPSPFSRYETSVDRRTSYNYCSYVPQIDYMVFLLSWETTIACNAIHWPQLSRKSEFEATDFVSIIPKKLRPWL